MIHGDWSKLFFLVVISMLPSVACDGERPRAGEPPPAPLIDPASSPTSENPIVLTGTAVPGALLQARGGAESVATTRVGADGTYMIGVPLRENIENVLLVSQVVDEFESDATLIEVVHDDLAPETPVLDLVASPTRQTTLSLRGSAEAESTITVRGGLDDVSEQVDASGRFALEVALDVAVAEITEHVLEIVATDLAGNESSAASLSIVHNPNLALDAPQLDPVDTPTAMSPVTLSGTTEPGLSIQVSGGIDIVTEIADESGVFSTSVELLPNTTNTLSVFASIPATGLMSPPSVVTIVHDSFPPEPPSLSPLASPTGATEIVIMGESESMAAIVVTGGASEAMTITDGAGQFNVEVELVPDEFNELFVTATDLAGNTSEPTLVAVEQDTTLPEPIVVDPLSSPTRENPISISGRTQSSVSIEITGGADEFVAVTSDSSGHFTATVALTPNSRNELLVTRPESEISTIVSVVHDDTSPEAPTLDPIASPTNLSVVTISGSTEPDIQLSVSGGAAVATGTADRSGRFSMEVSIPSDASSTLSVIATDRAGNASAPSTLEIEHSSVVPDAPIVDEIAPPPTSATTEIVSGRITDTHEGVFIEVRGGASVATTMTDSETGLFSVEVSLNPNVENTLEVVSVDGAIESPPTFVTVTHDDIAPAAPDAAIIIIGSPVLSSCLGRMETISVTGGVSSVEAFARVQVLNATAGSIMVSVDALGDGSFSTSIRACNGDLLRFTASDGAENVSEPTELAVTR